MSEIDMTQTLPAGVENMIVAGIIMVLSVIIVMVIVLMKRWHARIIPLFLGLIAYLLFVFVCSNLIISALALIPNIEAAFTYNPEAYTVLYCMIASVASLAAKYVLSSMLMERYERKGDVYMAGIGLGLGDVFLYAMTAASSYVWCLAINDGGLSSVFIGMSEEEVLSTYASIEMIFVSPIVIWILFGLNSLMDMLVQFALTSLIFGTVKRNLDKKYYSIAAVVTFVSLIAFQLYEETSLVNILIWFAVKVVIFTAVMYYSFHIAGKGIEYSEE